MIRVMIFGDPAAKGSPKVQIRDRHGNALRFPRVLPDSPKLEAWHKTVAGAGMATMHRRTMFAKQPLAVFSTFWLRRPQKPEFDVPAVKPDLDKLTRATMDPLEGIVFKDDSHIVFAVGRKLYADPDPMGAELFIVPASDHAQIMELMNKFAGSPAKQLQLGV